MEIFLDKSLRICYNRGEVRSLGTSNICKFIAESEHSELKTVQFILEKDPQTQASAVCLSSYRMCLISQGTGTFSFDTQATSVKTGDLLFGFPGETVRVLGQDLEYFYIDFKGLRAEDLFLRFGITPVSRCFPGQEGSLPFWSESIARADEENGDIVSECVLMYTFSRLSSVRQGTEDTAVRMTRSAEENFSNPGFSLNSLAEEWGYNPKYLSDLFRRRMNVGFSRYLKTVRIKHAVFLMDHGVASVKNVAYLCGFQDPLYFSKVFREEVGYSPTEYFKKNLS